MNAPIRILLAALTLPLAVGCSSPGPNGVDHGDSTPNPSTPRENSYPPAPHPGASADRGTARPPLVELRNEDPNLVELAWLAGSWVCYRDDRRFEEHWMPAAGGSMIGMHRDIWLGRSGFFEYLRIEHLPEGRTVFIASPLGKGETVFESSESSSSLAVFENLEHDYPKRIHYWIDDTDRLHTRIDGGVDDEQPQLWIYERARITR